ncbi:MAG: HAD family hydrolase [Candidatus Thorarchaeota archaeon]|nr:HAD family hydrolase [Candidatus Thorarchaeota archaeon]
MTDTNQDIEAILQTVRENPTYLNLWSAYKKFENLDLPVSEESNSLSLAVIGSSTLEPLAACIDIKTKLDGFQTSTFVGGFNTYRQEALDQKSPLYKAKPDVIVLSVDAGSVLGQMFLTTFVRASENERVGLRGDLVSSIAAVIEVLEKNTSAIILVNNFIVPVFSPLGIVDNKQKTGLKRFFDGANTALTGLFMKSNRVFIVDLESISSDFGKSRIINWNTWYRGSIPFSEDFTPVLADEYLRYIRALRGRAKKCIVLDLDNTLWGGIIGEDGIEGIKLSNTSPGIEYVDFQRGLLSLYNRGVILAVCSKNNLDDALNVFQEHPFQVLKEEHFAAMRINWQNKAANIAELANEINIGLDSMVFFDDNPVERAQVSQAFPEVLVVDLPKNPRLYRETLENLNVFDVLSLTKEDLARGEMYVGKRKRVELETSADSIEDFLRTLDLKVRIRPVDDFDTPRVVQLIGKTNQFNLTTRRYTDAEVQQFRDDENSIVYSMAVTDKFGDEGVVGVAIIKKKNGDWWIDTLLMSCRVIGRSAETALLAKIVADARGEGVSRIIGEIIPTKKNPPAADLYEKHGFGMPAQTDENGTSWILNLETDAVDVPDWIELIEE